jgi:hypothetical protein
MKWHLLLLIGITACARQPLPAKADPEAVQVIDRRKTAGPEKGTYRRIRDVDTTERCGAPESEVLASLRMQGARIGADAVLVTSVREVWIGSPDSGECRLKGYGTAIAFQ